MSHGGMMIRLIDVVLILLFGFISISEVSEKSELVLPTSTLTPVQSRTKEKPLIVGITLEGTYLVRNGAREISTPEDLYLWLLEQKETGAKDKIQYKVRVRPHKDTPIRHTMVVSAICDQLGLPKGLDVKKVAMNR